MPFGVMRFRKLHATWVSTVGTNGRSMVTQPRSAVAHAIGIERPEDQGEHRPSPGRVRELLLDRVPVDALEARDRDREREQDAGEHPDVHQAESLHLERRDVLGAGRRGDRGAELLEHLAEVLDAGARRRGAARRAGSTGSPRSTRSGPRAGDRGRDRAIVADERRGVDEERWRRHGRASRRSAPTCASPRSANAIPPSSWTSSVAAVSSPCAMPAPWSASSAAHAAVSTRSSSVVAELGEAVGRPGRRSRGARRRGRRRRCGRGAEPVSRPGRRGGARTRRARPAGAGCRTSARPAPGTSPRATGGPRADRRVGRVRTRRSAARVPDASSASMTVRVRDVDGRRRDRDRVDARAR